VSGSTTRQCSRARRLPGLSCRRLFGPLFTTVKGYWSPFYHTKCGRALRPPSPTRSCHPARTSRSAAPVRPGLLLLTHHPALRSKSRKGGEIKLATFNYRGPHAVFTSLIDPYVIREMKAADPAARRVGRAVRPVLVQAERLFWRGDARRGGHLRDSAASRAA
jgi:hypothetical protein